MKRLQQNGKQLDLTWSEMSGAYEVELGWALTWRMYSWHSAWYCQSHRLLPKSPPPQAPSLKSYTPVLWKEKEKSKVEIWSWVTLCNLMYVCTVCQRWISTLSEIFITQWGYNTTWFIRNLQAEDEHMFFSSFAILAHVMCLQMCYFYLVSYCTFPTLLLRDLCSYLVEYCPW